MKNLVDAWHPTLVRGFILQIVVLQSSQKSLLYFEKETEKFVAFNYGPFDIFKDSYQPGSKFF